MSTVKVEGEVVKVYPKNFKLVERYHDRQGAERQRWFTVWTQEAPAEHAWVTVEGRLGAKVSAPKAGDDRRFVDLSINAPTVRVQGSAQRGHQDDESAGWSTYTGERVFGRQPGAQGFNDGSVPF